MQEPSWTRERIKFANSNSEPRLHPVCLQGLLRKRRRTVASPGSKIRSATQDQQHTCALHRCEQIERSFGDRVKMIGWLLLAVIFVSGIADVSRAQGSSGPCQELSDCRFYTCLNDRLGCSKDDYPLAYGHRYCHRSNVNRHLFNSQVSRLH